MNKTGIGGKKIGHHLFLKIKFMKYKIYNKNIRILMVNLIVLKMKSSINLELNKILYFIKTYVVLKEK
jgi:hypothetical protein